MQYLRFLEGWSTNKCAMYSTFLIWSNQESSQLGAKLSFNSLGGLYACGAGQDVSAENIDSGLLHRTHAHYRSGIKPHLRMPPLV